ncbi:hypothetical protein [Methylobacterium indicum]|uniref:hypothetical protein n=1 Tax=Methylobacterium indicum TaxID=1775910 RepID=UPI000F7B0452|nr:hypothetical protein [Methylobacterium indicum]
MSRRQQQGPSVFDMDAVRLDVPGAEPATSAIIEEAPVEVQAPKRGRPVKTTTKPKATPFYLHPAVKEVLRDICYHHRVKEHDLFIEGLDLVLKKRAYPSIAEIIAQAEAKKS